MTAALGSTFTRYEVYRATSSGASIGSSTLLTRFTVASRTEFVDSTAKPNATYWYRVYGVTTDSTTGVATSAASNEVSATMPAEGTARLTLQESSGREQATVVRRYDLGGTCPTGEQNGGSTTDLAVGVSASTTVKSTSRALLRFDVGRIPAGATISAATLTMPYAATAATALSGTVQAVPVTKAWSAGTGVATCFDDGANWTSPVGGLDWATPGGDSAGTPISSAASTHAPAGGADGTDTFTLTNTVQSWVNGSLVNQGLLLKMSDEAYPAAGSSRLARYYPDDATTASKRPKLVVTYQDASVNEAPSAVMATPAAGSLVTGTVDLSSFAADDGKVTKVEYLLDSTVVGTSTGAPWKVPLDTVARAVTAGSHTLKARATDDIGNVATGDPITVTVDNRSAVTGTVTGPTAGATIAATPTTLTATVSDTTRTREVAFLVDDVQVGSADITSPYSTSWATVDQLTGLWNGNHTVAARVTDVSGRVTTSPTVAFTVNNTGTTRYAATLVAQNPAAPPAGQPRDPVNPNDPFPPVLVTAAATTGSTQDPYAGSPGSGATGGALGSANRNLNTAPSGLATTGCPTGAFCPTVTVTNTSTKTWTKGSDFELWYRFYAANGAVMSEGKAATTPPDNFAPNATADIPLTVTAPALPPQSESADLRLRVDVYDKDTTSATPAPKWFAQSGNAPLDVPVRVVRQPQATAKDLDSKVGLEKFWTYESEPAGAGSSVLTNVANGNMLWRWTPLALPGRGLSTGIDLTYNALEDHSHSVVGENFSLGIPSLTRLGEQLDVHPNKADRISGQSNKWISFADGDGTVHRFTGNTDGSWTAPPGVDLFLRKVGANESDARYWAISRPDFVTFYFTYDGYPSATVDRNNNVTTFTLENVPPGGDPGGPKQRVASLTEPGGRVLKFTYYSKQTAPTPRVRGELATVENLTAPGGGATTPALRLAYYDDGNLLRLTQLGGVGTDGQATPDRSFVFTYTTSAGDAPALAAAARVNPDPHTPNQSVRLATIADPRGAETKLVYRGPGAGQQRWWLASRTNRGGETTTYSYDVPGRSTTITDAGSHTTGYAYDVDGKVTQITNAKGEKTSYEWNANFHPTKITDDDLVATTLTWNANGYLTSQTAPGETGGPSRVTTLCYTNIAVDGTDTGTHGSLLTAVIKPASDVAGAADPCTALTGTSTHVYRYAYTNKNLTTASDPAGGATSYVWNVDPSPDRGTLASATDPRGNTTTFLGYHASGQPTSVKDAEDGVTAFSYTNDGDLAWVQTPLHASVTGPNDYEYRTKLYYDPFHRPTRSSEPKTYFVQPGVVIWTSTTYDPNDNPTIVRNPVYGNPDYPATAPHIDTIFDAMDRPTSITGPDRHLPGNEKTTLCYDSEGRLAKVLSPLSTGTCATASPDRSVVYDYDPLHRVVGTTRIGATGEANRASWTCYDNVGNPVVAIAPNAGVTTAPSCGAVTAGPYMSTADYNPDHSPRLVTDPKGRTTLLRYDPNGQVESVRRQLTDGATPSYATETYSRDQRGLVTKRVLPFEAGHSLTYLTEYDANGNITREVSPRGFDAATDKTQISDYATGYRYDKLNRLVRVALPTGPGTPAAFEHYGYDADSRLDRKSLPVADAELTDTSWSNIPVTSRTTYGLLDTGWIEASDDNVTPQVMFDYTAEGWQSYRVPRLTKNNSSAWNTDLEMRWTYFNDGTLKNRVDEDEKLAFYDYDANNNPTTSQSQAGVVDGAERAILTTTSYNGFDEPTRVNETKLLDDQATRNTLFTTFGYDRDGNLTFRGDEGKQNNAGTVVDQVKRNTFDYDTDDRLLRSFAQGRDTGCAGDRRVSYDFTAAGWLKTRTVAKSTGGCVGGVVDTATGAYPGWDTSQTENFTYLDNGDLATRNLVNGAGTVLATHALSYDQQSADATLPSAYTGQRTRDRWATGTGGQCQVGTGGAPACATTWQFDARGKLTDYKKALISTGNTLARTTYALDEATVGLQADPDLRAGNVTTETDTVTAVTTTRTFTGNQLDTTTVGGAVTNTFFDSLGRVDCVTTAAGAKKACSPRPGQTPSNNLLIDYDYDYLDRLWSVRTFSTGSLTDKTTYVNDALDRVVSQTETHTKLAAGGSTLTRSTAYTYSGLSRQVASEKLTTNGSTSTGPTGEAANGSTPACGPQNGTDTATYTTSSATKSYSYDPLGWRFRMADDLTCTTGSGSSYDRSTSATFGQDPQGSVELVTRDQAETTTTTTGGTTNVVGAGQGSVRAKYSYGPYGALDTDRSQGDLDTTSVFNPWRYTGKRYDTGSATLDMGTRRYDPGSARFLQQDLYKGALDNLGLSLDPLSQNRYALASGNPTSNIELDGHRSVTVGHTYVKAGSQPLNQRIVEDVSEPNTDTTPRHANTITESQRECRDQSCAAGDYQNAEFGKRCQVYPSLCPGGQPNPTTIGDIGRTLVSLTPYESGKQCFLAGAYGQSITHCAPAFLDVVLTLIPEGRAAKGIGEAAARNAARRTAANGGSRIAANQAAGNAARDALAAAHPGSLIEQTFSTTAGVRRLDILTQGGLGIESKVGRTSLTAATRSQIAKDSLLIKNGDVTGIEWVFSPSGVTGRAGPTGPLADALGKAGIPWSLAP